MYDIRKPLDYEEMHVNRLAKDKNQGFASIIAH